MWTPDFRSQYTPEEENGFVYNLTTSYEKDENGNQIPVVRDVAQTKGGPGGDALQFFVSTKLNEMVISVIGLFPNHKAIFTMIGGQDSVTPITSTFQLSPSINEKRTFSIRQMFKSN